MLQSVNQSVTSALTERSADLNQSIMSGISIGRELIRQLFMKTY